MNGKSQFTCRYRVKLLAVSEPLQIIFIEAELMADLVQQRHHDFFVYKVVGLGLLKAACECDDSFPEQVDVRREHPRLVHGLLGFGNAGVQTAERHRFFLIVRIDPEFDEHLSRGAIKRDHGHLVDEISQRTRKLPDGFFKERVEPVSITSIQHVLRVRECSKC